MTSTRLGDLFDDRSQLISFDFPDLLNAYLDLSGRTFDSVLSQTPRPAIDLVDYSGKTTLSWAARRGDHEAVKRLLNCGADPDHADMSGATPLHWSLSADHTQCMQLLLAAKANVDAKDRDGNTALNIACKINGDASWTETLLSHKSDIESMNDFGCRPLHSAVINNEPKTVSLLLHRDPNINAVSSSDGDTALMYGVTYNCHKAAGILLEHKTLDYGGKGYWERTVLHWAALFADLEMIALLQSAKLSNIDTMAVDTNGGTALYRAVWRRDCNEEWSNWAVTAADEDPLEWFVAFEALLDGIVERTKNSHVDETTEDTEQEIWEDAPESADTSSG